MAGGDISKVFSELESDEHDFSLETSVPTDLTLSMSHDTTDDVEQMQLIHDRNKYKLDSKSAVTKQLLERKKLLHDLQVLKIEVSQKTMLLDNQKSQYQQRTEELEEQLNDAMHEKHILQVRLESELRIQEEESKRRTANIRKELEELGAKQKKLEETNKMLGEKADCVRGELKDLSINNATYCDLRRSNEDSLSLKDYLRVKFYEVQEPIKAEIAHLTNENNDLNEQLDSLSEKCSRLQVSFESEKKQHAELRIEYQKNLTSLADTREKVKIGNYKVENFDRIKIERDSFETRNADQTRQVTSLEASLKSLEKERDDLYQELSLAKQSLSLMKQDKEYLSKTLTETQNRCVITEERHDHLMKQVDDTKAARDELYEKLLTSREIYKNEYESKLNDELDKLRIQTDTEMEKLRTTSHEMYERENRNLRESRDLAISEKDRAQKAEKEILEKYENLLNEFRKQQSASDCMLSESNSQLKIKEFECERTQLVFEETVQNNKQSLLEVEKLQKKIEVLTKEFYAMQTSYDKKVAELESQANERDIRLQSYEKLEEELDTVVLQAAEAEDEEDAEKILFSYGYGAVVPSNSKARLRQNAQLARRLLALERINSGLQQDLKNEKERSEELMKDLNNANDLLGQSQQPYNYLIDNIRLREHEVRKTREESTALNKRILLLEQENEKLSKTSSQMSIDIEKLLNQKQDLDLVKKTIISLKSSKSQISQTFSCSDLDQPFEPGPVLYTKDVTNWYQKLQDKLAAYKNY